MGIWNTCAPLISVPGLYSKRYLEHVHLYYLFLVSIVRGLGGYLEHSVSMRGLDGNVEHSNNSHICSGSLQ